MQRVEMKHLYDVLVKELEVAKRRMKINKKSSNEMQKTAAGSWSAAGEREYSRGQAQITQEYYEKLQKILDKVRTEILEDTPVSISPDCFIEVEKDGKTESFYLVDDPVNIKGIKIISSSSPLGTALLGKNKGDSYQFEVGGILTRGKVLNIT